MKSFLTIDPGVPFGWAYYSDDQPSYIPFEFGVMKQTHVEDWQDRTTFAGTQLIALIRQFHPQKVYCERPTYFPGHAAAARGSFEKLCMVVGRFMQVCSEKGIRMEFVNVRDWMGQMTDAAIRHRASAILGEEYVAKVPAHAIDAVGIGLYVMGKWPHD